METLLEKFAGRKFFFVSLGVIAYFCFLLLNAYIIHSRFVLIGFIQEILTLPLLLFQLILFVFSLTYCIKDKFRIKTYSFWSFLFLLVSNSYFLGSLIISKI